MLRDFQHILLVTMNVHEKQMKVDQKIMASFWKQLIQLELDSGTGSFGRVDDHRMKERIQIIHVFQVCGGLVGSEFQVERWAGTNYERSYTNPKRYLSLKQEHLWEIGGKKVGKE